MESEDILLESIRRHRLRLGGDEDRWFAGTCGARHRDPGPSRDVDWWACRGSAETQRHPCRRRRVQAHADQPQELAICLIGHAVQPVDHQLGQVREKLEEDSPWVARRGIGPGGGLLQDDLIGFVEELGEIAVVEIRGFDRHATSPVRLIGSVIVCSCCVALTRYSRMTFNREASSGSRCASRWATSIRGSQRSIARRT